MKTFRIILVAFILAASLAPLFAVRPAEAASGNSCNCICAPDTGTYNCDSQGISKDLVIGRADSTADMTAEDVCRKKCSAAICMGFKSCTKSDCWCKDKQGSNVWKPATGDVGECQKTCSEANLEYGSWGSPPASKKTDFQCPPGGVWTEPECTAVKDATGANASWEPPDQGSKSGPYCFAPQPAIKLSVYLGGLTTANLSQYLAAAYRVGLGIAAILAVIMIMAGGLRYIAAAGGGDIEAAKDMIKNAVVGLVLTALSYTLLLTVNPDILSLRLPRVQIVKPCNMAISCTSRTDADTCNNNTADTHCSWNIVQSTCVDLSRNGDTSGECQRGADGEIDLTKPCAGGGKCIKIDSNNYKCSKGDKCQPCSGDADCGDGKCQDNICQVPDPTGNKGTYLKCAGQSCDDGKECEGGFCNGSKKCGGSTQGTSCLEGGQKDCGNGYTCLPFTVSNGNRKACCLSGKKDGCLGCTSDSFCPNDMFCLNATQLGGLKSGGYDAQDSYLNRCLQALPEGLPCGDSNQACQHKKCVGGICVK